MAANVTIHHSAFSDRRIAYMGELAGYSQMEALGRLATLWSRCTELQTDAPGGMEIRAALGPRGEHVLVESGLGEVVANGEIRVRGCAGRHEWFGEVANKRANGGRARIAGAQRDQHGRLLPSSKRETLANAGPAILNAGPASPAATSRSKIQIRDRDPHALPEPSSREIAIADPGASDPGKRARETLRREIWGLLQTARSEVGAALGEPLRALPAFDQGLTALAMRILDYGDDLARAEGDLRHVVDVRRTEALFTRETRWLSGATFESNSYRTALAASVAEMKRARPARASAPETAKTIRLKARSDDDMPPLPPLLADDEVKAG